MSESERRVAIEVARAAGDLLRRELDRPRRIEYKGAPTNLVTEMDARAETLILQALEVEPDAPDVRNNLAAAYEMQGRQAEAEALVARIFERHPDYLFGRTSMAQLYVRDGKIEEAEALLEPLLTRQRFHHLEFAAFCNAQIELYRAQGKREGAESWLKMWAAVDPDNPAIARLRRSLGRRGR